MTFTETGDVMVFKPGSLVAFRALAIGLFLMAVPWCMEAGSQQGEASASPKSGTFIPTDTYRAPLLNNPKTLDPAYIQDIYSRVVANQLFDGLVRYSRDLFVIPSLAETWQVEEQGKLYRFTLRPNATFHDGQPVTATDVVFSLSRLFRVSPRPTVMPYLMRISGAQDYMVGKASSIAGLEAVDGHTVVVRLDEPYAPFLVALGIQSTFIVPAKLAVHEEKFRRSPIGSGPFKLVSWSDGESISLERFPAYFAGPSRLDGIDFIIYPGVDIDQVWKDFKDAKLDEMPFYPKFREESKAIQSLKWLRRPSLSLQFYGFNTTHPILGDPEVRSALLSAIDRRKLAAVAYGGELEPAMGILPPGLPGYQPGGPETRVDPRTDGARLDEIRRKLGSMTEPLEVVSNSQSATAKAELEFVRESWGALGIKMRPRFVPDWGEFEAYLQSNEMQIYRYAWFADIPDTDDFLRVLFASDSPVNYMRYRNPDIDEMLRNAAGTMDLVQRATSYREIEQRIMKDTPMIPLTNLTVDLIYQSYVHDLEVTALGPPAVSYHRVWLDRKATR
jgi:ABC-type transport system substrate-binding protein